MTNSKVMGFEAYEVIGVSIPNPRAVAHITVPPNLTPEQLAAFEAWIDQTNAQLEAEAQAEEARILADADKSE